MTFGASGRGCQWLSGKLGSWLALQSGQLGDHLAHLLRKRSLPRNWFSPIANLFVSAWKKGTKAVTIERFFFDIQKRRNVKISARTGSGLCWRWSGWKFLKLQLNKNQVCCQVPCLKKPIPVKTLWISLQEFSWQIDEDMLIRHFFKYLYTTKRG